MSIGSKHLKGLLCALILGAPLLINAPSAGAFFLTDWLNSAKQAVTNQAKPQASVSVPTELTISSKIYHALNGDLNKDNLVDSGEVVTFEYIVTNPTKTEYKYAILETNINKALINFIHNLSGATGLSQDDNTVKIRNLRIPAASTVVIKFDARVNYFSTGELTITTEPVLLAEDKKEIKRAQKVENKAKAISTDKLPKAIQKLEKKAN